MTTDELIANVKRWGAERNITGPDAVATPESQYAKLIEEVEEIGLAIHTGSQHGIVDGIGDATVVLILLSELIGIPFQSCLQVAYEEIRDRTGRMINGTFVKDADLDEDFDEPLPERTVSCDGDVCESCQ